MALRCSQPLLVLGVLAAAAIFVLAGFGGVNEEREALRRERASLREERTSEHAVQQRVHESLTSVLAALQGERLALQSERAALPSHSPTPPPPPSSAPEAPSLSPCFGVSVDPQTCSGMQDPATVGLLILTGQLFSKERIGIAASTWMRWLPPDFVGRGNLLVVSDSVETLPGPRGSTITTYFAPDSCCGRGPSQLKWPAGIKEFVRRAPPGLQWALVLDDDTYLVVPNALRLLKSRDVTSRTYYGELCSEATGFSSDDASVSVRDFKAPMHCGGAGFAIPFALLRELAEWMTPRPWPFVREEGISDRAISWVLFRDLRVSFSYEHVFSSQPPAFYLRNEKNNKPDGFGTAVSFHYVRDATEARELFILLSAAFGTQNDTARLFPTSEMAAQMAQAASAPAAAPPAPIPSTLPRESLQTDRIMDPWRKEG